MGLTDTNTATVYLSFYRGNEIIDTRTVSYGNSYTPVSFGYTVYTPAAQLVTTVPITSVTNLQRLNRQQQPCTIIDDSVEQLPFFYNSDRCWARCFDQAYFQSVYNCSALSLEKTQRNSTLPLCPSDAAVQIDVALVVNRSVFLMENFGQNYEVPDTQMEQCLTDNNCNSALACSEWDFEVGSDITTMQATVNTKTPVDLRLVADWISELKSWGNWVHTVEVIPGKIEVITEFQINCLSTLVSNIGGIVNALTNLHCVIILNAIVLGARKVIRR